MEVKKNTLFKLILAILFCTNAQNALAEIDCDSVYAADLKQCEDIYNDWSCGISMTCAFQRQSFWMDCSNESLNSLYECRTEQAKRIAKIYEGIIETSNKTIEIQNRTEEINNRTTETINQTTETINQTTETINQTTETNNEATEAYIEAEEAYKKTVEIHNETTEMYNQAIENYNQAAQAYKDINN